MHRLHLRRRADGRLRRDLAAEHPTTLAPIPRRNAVMLADQRRVLRRRLVRQTLQIRHRLRMAELRVPCLACHDSLFRSRPDARRPPFAGLRKPRRDRPMLNPDAPDCNPPKRRQSDRRRKRKTDFTQKYKPHTQKHSCLWGLTSRQATGNGSSSMVRHAEVPVRRKSSS